MKHKLAELNKLVDMIQQSSAHIETFTEPQSASLSSEPNTRVEQAAPAQKEMEREQRWERYMSLTLPYLTFGVGKLLHLPSAVAVSVRPSAQPRCNQRSR